MSANVPHNAETSTPGNSTLGSSTPGKPSISVVLATRGRRDRLKGCLESLARQNYPHAQWEVIVVEDGDREPLDPGLVAVSRLLPLRWFRVDHAGCGTAKNAGAWQALGQHLVFTDDDCLFPADWLRLYAQEFGRDPDALVIGAAVNPGKSNPYSETSQELVNYSLSRLNGTPNAASFAVGNNFGVPAEGFRQLGGFNPSYYPMAGEDRDFAAHWVATGRPSRYVPQVLVEHRQVLTLRSLLRQQYFYGRGAFTFHRLEAERRNGPVALAAPGFYLSLLVWPWVVRKGVDAARMGLLFFCSQAAHTWGYLRAAFAPRQPGGGRIQSGGGRMQAALASLSEVELSPDSARETRLQSTQA